MNQVCVTSVKNRGLTNYEKPNGCKMRELKDERIKMIEGKYQATCVCGTVLMFAAKSSARKMLDRGSCRSCKRDYRSLENEDIAIYQNDDGRWCSTCSGCGIEQPYTRKDHAKQSSVSDWQCKKCVQGSKVFSANLPVGNKTRVYRKFKKSAKNRRIEFNLSEEEFFAEFSGFCKLTNWPIALDYGNTTASCDRIDNNKGYINGNIHWVHVKVNMARGKRALAEFIDMCESITANLHKNKIENR